MHWKEWTPDLHQGDKTLREFYDSMPRADAEDIDELVRMFENPESKYAFPGVVNLFRHDCIHILLGRGMLPQDEAFVIGYTMGTAKERITWDQMRCFRMIAKVAYKPPYDFSEDDMIAFDLGFSLGIIDPCQNIFEVTFKDLMDMPCDTVRNQLGINKDILFSTYRTEVLQIPNTTVSNRLQTK